MKLSGEFSTLRGNAENVKFMIERGMHIASLDINKQAVQIYSGTPMVINNGDQIMVAGFKEGGILSTPVYRNITRSIDNLADWKKVSGWPMKVFAIILILVGTVFIFAIFPVVFIFIGVSNYKKAGKLRMCIKALEKT